MATAGNNAINWSLACYFNDADGGKMTILRHDGQKTSEHPMALDKTTYSDPALRPVLLGVAPAGKAITLDPKSKEIHAGEAFPVEAFAAHAYPDPYSNRVWYMNDGDKQTGNDTLNCGKKGSSVWVVDKANPLRDGEMPALLATICVGRGHHVTVFSAPSDDEPETPKRAFVSNLLDGSITVIGNDPDNADTYLQVITTISLFDEKREAPTNLSIPNKSNPHGMVFSPYTGKVYCLNNGYSTVSVIDPFTNDIEANISLPVSKTIMMDPKGRFLVGKGSDREADPAHVIGKLPVVDLITGELFQGVDIPDIYPAKYSISSDGSKTYITTAATGNDQQKANLKKDAFQIYDSSRLPDLKLIKEVKVGVASGHTRSISLLEENGKVARVFVSNPTDGTVSVIDGQNHAVLETIKIAGNSSHSRIWTI